MKDKQKIKIDIEGLKTILAFSNTPVYLFKHFRSNKSIQTFGENTSLNKIKELIKIQIDNLTSIKDMVLLYAYIISLSMHNSIESIEVLEELRSEYSHIRWLSKIISLVENSQFDPISFQYIDATPKPEIKSIREEDLTTEDEITYLEVSNESNINNV